MHCMVACDHAQSQDLCNYGVPTAIAASQSQSQCNYVWLLWHIAAYDGQYMPWANIGKLLILSLAFYFNNHVQNQLLFFMLMTCEFRHMKMLKCSAHAYDPGGVSATHPGSLTIPCRVCPLPNINLPPGWEDVSPARVYVQLFYCLL